LIGHGLFIARVITFEDLLEVSAHDDSFVSPLILAGQRGDAGQELEGALTLIPMVLKRRDAVLHALVLGPGVLGGQVAPSGLRAGVHACVANVVIERALCTPRA